MAWSIALWLLVYFNTLRLENLHSTLADGKTHKPRIDAEVTQLPNICGDGGIGRLDVKKSKCLFTAGQMSSTVVRKQFHAVAVAVFLPGLLADVNMLRVAVSCVLVVFVMLEVSAVIAVCAVLSITLMLFNDGAKQRTHTSTSAASSDY